MRTFIFVPGHNKEMRAREEAPGIVSYGWEPSKAGKSRCEYAAWHKGASVIVTGDLTGGDHMVPNLSYLSYEYLVKYQGVEAERVARLPIGYYSAEEARAVADYLLPKSGELAKEGVLLIVATSADHGEMIAYALHHLFRNDPFLKSVKIRVGIADESPAYSWLTRQILWAVYRLDPAWERWPSAPLRWIANRRR